jgi:serine/threonine protein kinase
MVEQVESRCSDVVDQLVRTREQVLAGELIGVLADRMEIVRRAAAGYDAWFSFAGSPQCVHGDITPGNVLFDESGKAVLCDFEDAAFSFRPRIFDLASAVLRFCLVPPPGVGGATASIRCTVLLEAYAHAGWAMSEPADLIRGIRNLIDHNVMIMCALTISGVESTSGEWNKFARMYEVLEEWV